MCESIHSLGFHYVDRSIRCRLVLQVVSIYDFLGDVAELDAYVLGSFEWCHEVEDGDVRCHEEESLGGDKTID